MIRSEILRRSITTVNSGIIARIAPLGCILLHRIHHCRRLLNVLLLIEFLRSLLVIQHNKIFMKNAL